ncbi:unnamed protein product [Effrenium voratum]|uniref:Uncharacterized protein n=1 Tax=Effrenium voratum TaxID=2562239 RepID=A0AA36MQZ1_9DINO|nr:unnamed protein product [Effrenium voratum]CAJ1448019.1 unnamed protein product [Effrenium voratum]
MAQNWSTPVDMSEGAQEHDLVNELQCEFHNETSKLTSNEEIDQESDMPRPLRRRLRSRRSVTAFEVPFEGFHHVLQESDRMHFRWNLHEEPSLPRNAKEFFWEGLVHKIVPKLDRGVEEDIRQLRLVR